MKALKLPWTKTVNITYQRGEFVNELVGWRGVSIFFVALLHYFPSIFRVSWVFMELIFVVSGFLITGILMDTKSRPNYYKSFIIRRLLRIFPLYYLCLFVTFFLLPHSWLDLTYYKQHQLWFWLYAENWLFAIDGWPVVKAFGIFGLWLLKNNFMLRGHCL